MYKKVLTKLFAVLIILSLAIMPMSQVEASSFRYVAHRGDMKDAPEESLAALKVGVANGYKYLEVDVWETNSGAWIVCHDSNLLRLCGKNIDISKLTSKNYSKYKYIMTYKGKQYSLISVDTALKYCKKAKVGLYLHVKRLRHGYSGAKKLVSKVKSTGMAKSVTFISSSTNYLSTVRKAATAISVKGLHYGFVKVGSFNASSLKTVYSNAKRLHCSWLIFGYYTTLPLNKILVSKAYVNKCKAAGIQISYYGITTQEQINNIKSVGCTSAITNVCVFKTEVEPIPSDPINGDDTSGDDTGGTTDPTEGNDTGGTTDSTESTNENSSDGTDTDNSTGTTMSREEREYLTSTDL